MTGIDNDNDIILYDVCEIPFACISHVEALPLLNRWFSPQQGSFDMKHGCESIINILVHQCLGIRMPVFPKYVSVK